MKFTYINYGEDIVENLQERMDTIYVFSDYGLKNTYKKSLKKNIFKGVPTILTFDEFKEKVFKTDKIILREAKRFISFFNGVKKELYELLAMESYYDVIDFADSFFRYYKELNEAMIEDIKNPQPWQEKYINNFKYLKKKYDVYLERKNYILMDWIYKKENINLDFIKPYKKIIFIDIMDFTPLEKEVIRRIQGNLEIEFLLQISREDYSEENLTIDSVTLPEKKNYIEVYEVSEDIEELLTLETLRGKSGGGEVYTPDISRNRYHKILPKIYLESTSAVLNDTVLYKFLKTQYDLIASLESRLNYKLPLLELKIALDNLEFREVYSINNEDLKELYNLLDEDYTYLNENGSEKFQYIYGELLKINEFTKVDDFVRYFKEDLNLEKFYEKEYENLFEKFYEAVTLAKTSEYMLGEEEFKKCFSKGSDIYKLILQYMNNIEINRVKATYEEGEKKVIVRDMEGAKNRIGRNTYFVDISSKTLPGNLGKRSLFSENQRKENNLSTKDKNRELAKHKFFQGVFNSKNTYIIYRKNEGKGEDISPFLTEIMETYNIKVNKKIIKEEAILKNLQYIYMGIPVKLDYTDDTLPKTNEDFPNGQCRIGAYDYDTLENCEYRFYLNKISEIEPLVKEWNKNISMKFLGIYVHSVLEKVIDNTWKNIVFENNFYVDEEWIEKLLLDYFFYNRDKIPVHLDNYFKEILIPRFRDNILKLFKELERTYSDKKIRRFESEKVNWDNREPFVDDEIKFYITGRVDFILESLGENLILDFKTGKKQDKQLDFYSILLYGDENKATKGIYNVFNGELEYSEKVELTRESLKESIINFLKKDTYSLSEKKSSCMYCEYMNICRRDF